MGINTCQICGLEIGKDCLHDEKGNLQKRFLVNGWVQSVKIKASGGEEFGITFTVNRSADADTFNFLMDMMRNRKQFRILLG